MCWIAQGWIFLLLLLLLFPFSQPATHTRPRNYFHSLKYLDFNRWQSREGNLFKRRCSCCSRRKRLFWRVPVFRVLNYKPLCQEGATTTRPPWLGLGLQPRFQPFLTLQLSSPSREAVTGESTWHAKKQLGICTQSRRSIARR